MFAFLMVLLACGADEPGAAERAVFEHQLTEALEASRVASIEARPCASRYYREVARFCDDPDQAKAEAILAAGIPLDCRCGLAVVGVSIGIGAIRTTVGEGTNDPTLTERAAMLELPALVDFLVAHGARPPEAR